MTLANGGLQQKPEVMRRETETSNDATGIYED
jgi:hypothetical protein